MSSKLSFFLRQRTHVAEFGRELTSNSISILNRKEREAFWDARVGELEARWGTEQQDFVLVRKALDSLTPSSLLEIGCGYGRYFPLYASIPYVVGIDISTGMLSRAAQKGHGVLLRHIAAEELDYPSNSFDLVVGCRVLAHIPPPLISTVIRLIANVSRLGCIILERTGDFVESDHTFSYNYPEFFHASDLSTAVDLALDDYAHFYVFVHSPVDVPKDLGLKA